MRPIMSRHRSNPLMMILIAVALAGMLASVPLSLWSAFAAPNVIANTVIGMVCLILAATIMRAVVRRDVETSTWTLDDESLVGGTQGASRIALADIVALSQGVPAGSCGRETAWHRSGLVIQTRDGRLLALNLLQAEGGLELMNALVERCMPVFTKAPLYTTQESALLQGPRWNRVLGPNGCD